MKTIKRIFFSLLIVGFLCFLFKGTIFRLVITYKSVGLKINYVASELNLTSKIDDFIKIHNDFDIEVILQETLDFTNEQLHFTFSKNDNDPNKLIISKSANCVGYATFFSSTFNYIINKYKLSHTWKASPQKGQLYFFNTNFHNYIKSPFFKDHDFVIIENLKTGQELAVDPTINDYFGIEDITYKK